MEEKYRCSDCDVEFDGAEAKQADYRCPDCGAELTGNRADLGINRGRVPKISYAILALICLVVATYFIWQSGDKTGGPADSSSKASAVDKILKKALEINSDTPLMIDPSTRLDRVVVEDKTITYKATLVNFSAKTTNKVLFNKKIGPFLANKYCSDKNSRKALELGVKYGNEYSGNNGTLLYSATIGVDDC